MSVAISGAWGGLFTSPFTAVLLNVELTFERRVLRWATIAAELIAVSVIAKIVATTGRPIFPLLFVGGVPSTAETRSPFTRRRP